MNILTYRDIQVDMIRKTQNPGHLIRMAMDITMKQENYCSDAVSQNSLAFLFSAEHTEIMGHVSATFFIHDLSKSALGQITRCRTAAKTSASQHYQVYTEYPHMVSEQLSKLPGIDDKFLNDERAYQAALDCGIPKEEARQVLSNAKAGNLLITFSAESLYVFFRKRLCLRNCEETRVIAEKMWDETYVWWPEFAEICGPPCMMASCNQGYLSCGKKYDRKI